MKAAAVIDLSNGVLNAHGANRKVQLWQVETMILVRISIHL